MVNIYSFWPVLNEELANEAMTRIWGHCFSNLSRALQKQKNEIPSEYIWYDLFHSELNQKDN